MFDILFPALGETIYMSFVATFFAVLIGFFLAIILHVFWIFFSLIWFTPSEK